MYVCCMFIDCGKRSFSEVTFEITSPDYPDYYGIFTHCLYYIHNPFNNILSLAFQTFAVEYESDCNYDNLTVGISL